MFVVGFYLGQRRPEFFQREAVDAGIDFVDVALLIGELRFLHNSLHRAFGFAQDASVAAGITDHRGQYGYGGVRSAVRGDHGAQRLGADQWRVARQDQGDFRLAHRAARDLHGMTGAALRLLHYALDLSWLDDRGNLLGLMANHGYDFSRFEWGARGDHVFHKAASAGPM